MKYLLLALALFIPGLGLAQTNTVTWTPTLTFTLTKTPIYTRTPTYTFTPSFTRTASYTPTNTYTFTPSYTFTPTYSPTPTGTPTPTFTPVGYVPGPSTAKLQTDELTPLWAIAGAQPNTATFTPTRTPTGSATPTNTPTVNLTSTVATNSPTPTVTPTMPAKYSSVTVNIAITPGIYAYSFTIPQISGMTEIQPNQSIVGNLGVSLYALAPGQLTPNPNFASSSVVQVTNNGPKFFTIYQNGFSGVNLSMPTSMFGVQVAATVTITPNVTIQYIITYALFTNIPEKNKYLFAKGYDEQHGFKIYWTAYKTDGDSIYYKPAYVRSMS